jgi:hydrogenase/urease accessory protein HupE
LRRPTIALRASLAAGLLALLFPARAEAHLVSTGLGPVYDGIGHMLTTPEDLIPAIALALFAGLRGAGPGRRALFLLPAAWFAGGLVGLKMGAAATFPLAPISFLFLGVLVAANAPLTARGVAVIALGLGLAHGFLNGIAFQGSPSGTLTLVGEATVLFMLLALVSAFVVSLERPWTRIAVRVAGSWIAAVGLLLLGWILRASPR